MNIHSAFYLDLSNTKCYYSFMKIGIIGGGASGTYLAIRIKEINPSFDVTIIERNDKLMKKIAVTGNGRCNYANLGSLENKYNHPFANEIIKNLPPHELVANFEGFGIHPTQIDNLIFPVSLSAQTVVLMLNRMLEKLDVNICLNEKVLDYENKDGDFIVKTDKQEHVFNKLVFANGGKAYPQLGTDGALYDVLRQHQYQIETLSPSLSPIKVKENTKKISGQRVKCLVKLFVRGKIAYAEEGEVLFKDDGLSGIVILNMSQKINELSDKSGVRLILDLAPSVRNIKKDQYEEYVNPKVAAYLIDNNLDINRLTFNFKNFYDFNIAEVSHGGVSLDEIDSSIESKREKGLYFVGEVLNIDGMCGGFNLMFAFASAETVAKNIRDNYV